MSKCFKPQNDKVGTAKKVTKINLRITAKRHAHLQTLTNTPAKYKKIRLKGFVMDSQTDRWMEGENNMSPNRDGGDIIKKLLRVIKYY